MVSEVHKEDRSLTPAFVDGELVEIHRTLPDGQRVIMFAEASEVSSLENHRVTLTARVKQVGVSPYADGRVANQKRSIERLLTHLQHHCQDADCPHLNQREGTDNDEDSTPAAPKQLINPDGSGYQV